MSTQRALLEGMERLDRANPKEPTRSSVRLFRRAREGDPLALDDLFGRQLSKLRRWARGRLPRWARDIADTTDIVQESLVNVFRRLDRFEPRVEGALQAYLRQAVLNRIRDEVRRAGRRPPMEELGEIEVAEPREPSPLDALIGAEAAARYHAALVRLRPEEREAIVARVELGYNYEQIALVLGKPSPDAARMAVARGLGRLAEEMDRDA